MRCAIPTAASPPATSSTCTTTATPAAIPDNAAYALSGFNAQGAAVPLGVGTTTLARTLPCSAFTLAEAQAATFPTIVTSSPLASYNGGALTISGTGANPQRPVWVPTTAS